MARRLELDAKLRALLEEHLGYVNIYFQPPDSVHLKYDCLIYSLRGYGTTKADDTNYLTQNEYDVTFISKDPESEFPKILFDSFSNCSPGRPFWTDNLFHVPCTIYF